MADRLSQRHHGSSGDDSGNDQDAIDWQKIGWLFIAFSVLSLLTSLYYTYGSKPVIKQSFQPGRYQTVCSGGKKPASVKCSSATIGPITVDQDKQVYDIWIDAERLPLQSWAFIEGQVLDANKQYLFSFGEELWHESGDSGGLREERWEEQDDEYDMTVTIPKKGRYYLRIKTQSNAFPAKLNVSVSARNGSSIPHFAFGVILAMIGGAILAYLKTGRLSISLIVMLLAPAAVMLAPVVLIFYLLDKIPTVFSHCSDGSP